MPANIKNFIGLEKAECWWRSKKVSSPTRAECNINVGKNLINLLIQCAEKPGQHLGDLLIRIY
ncbi:hypothetical protein FTO70_14970 [Methanosarcina sp. KYL-1]|uniref:hypothetical protein n=1 Tax=Methanosarcina sp. KYL-1 TaxID=2602068 RepID=UPI002100B233|nr:hypothetical protein [Methanosarcina sp. KYL-1]MCQ1536950.1 hypothetical protein [Methanosarcina sp. KYL-1]